MSDYDYAKLESIIRQTAPSVFINTILSDGVCKYCRAPSANYDQCHACYQAMSQGFSLTPNASSFYATFSRGKTKKHYSEAHDIMEKYKLLDNPIKKYKSYLAIFLTLALDKHRECIAKSSGLEISHWSVIPSTNEQRPCEHPLRELILRTKFANVLDEVKLKTQNFTKSHDIDVDRFSVDGTTIPRDASILLIDDSWTKGGNIRSAKQMLLSNFDCQVTMFSIARLLDLDWPPNVPFYETSLKDKSFNSAICPWLGRECGI